MFKLWVVIDVKEIGVLGNDIEFLVLVNEEVNIKYVRNASLKKYIKYMCISHQGMKPLCANPTK